MFYQVTSPTLQRHSAWILGNNPPSAGGDSKTRSGKGLIQGPLEG